MFFINGLYGLYDKSETDRMAVLNVDFAKAFDTVPHNRNLQIPRSESWTRPEKVPRTPEQSRYCQIIAWPRLQIETGQVEDWTKEEQLQPRVVNE